MQAGIVALALAGLGVVVCEAVITAGIALIVIRAAIIGRQALNSAGTVAGKPVGKAGALHIVPAAVAAGRFSAVDIQGTDIVSLCIPAPADSPPEMQAHGRLVGFGAKIYRVVAHG